MSNPNLKLLLKEYEQKRLKKQLDLENKLNNFYIKNPNIAQINDKINRTSIEITKTILLNKNDDKIKNLNSNLDDFKKQKQEKMNKLKKDIARKLGKHTGLTQYEEAYIEKWLQEYKYDLEIIELALKKTTSKSNPNFDYIDKIISDWHDRKLLNSEDVKNYLLEFKNKSKQIKELEKKTGYQNYDQRNIDNFDNFYANN